MKFLSFLFLLVLSVSCIKTAEQVNREKRIDSMKVQLSDSQGLVADMVSQMKDMQGQLDKLNGRMDEIEHRNKNIDPDGINRLNESVNLIKTQSETQGTQLLQIQNELKEQRGFIEKVTSSLNNATTESQNKPQKKSAKSELSRGLRLIQTDDYNDARETLEDLIDHPDLTPGDQNKVLHGLGKVEYFSKNYEKGLVFFSKIYSRFPKASLAPSSLLFIARSLKKMDKADEANEAYEKVISDYPSSLEAKEAKKEM